LEINEKERLLNLLGELVKKLREDKNSNSFAWFITQGSEIIDKFKDGLSSPKGEIARFLRFIINSTNRNVPLKELYDQDIEKNGSISQLFDLVIRF